MSLADEIYADGRSSVAEGLLPYAAQRLTSRTTAISEPRRFFTLFVGIFACVCASTSYVYNLFSGNLQEKYSFTQSDMATITTVAGILCLATFPLSSVYDYFGPKPLFVVSFISFPLGAVMFGLALHDVIEGSVARFTIFNALLGIGSGMFDIAGLMTIMSVFPSSRGAVIAVMKTYIGLGSAIFGAIQLGFFEHDVTGFFYFMAACVAVVSVFCFVFISLPPYCLTGYEEKHLIDSVKGRRGETKRAYFEQIPPARRFYAGFAVVAMLILFLPAQSAAVAYLELGHEYKMALAVATCVLLFSSIIVALPLRFLDRGPAASSEPLITQEGGEDDVGADGGDAVAPITPQALLRASQQVSAMIASTRGSIVDAAVFTMPVVDETQHIAPQYHTTFRESVCSLQLWALSYSLFCIIGAQLVIIVNARFIYGAIAEEPVTPAIVTLLTVVNGVGSAVGRILMSMVEVWTQKRPPAERIPLTVSLFIPSSVVLASVAMILVATKELLLVPFVLAALGNGFMAATVVLVMRTLYARDVALHYNFTSLAATASAIVFNKLLYGEWYTYQAEKQHNTLCVGRDCVFVPFAVMSVMLLTSFITNAYVHVNYRSYCEQVLSERAGGAPAAAAVPPPAADTGRLPSQPCENEEEGLLS